MRPFGPPLAFRVDRSQSLFDFVPQEKGLIWRPPWGWKNMGESIFHWENWPNDTKKWPKVGANMPRVAGNWSEFFFVHYSGRRSHFPAGDMQIVLNPVFKDFSRAGVSYFSPLHFPNCSSTTFAGWLWNIVTVKEWHFSAGVVQIVLKRVHKDFSQARFSYSSPLYFPNYPIRQRLSIKENICAERPRKSYALQDAKK